MKSIQCLAFAVSLTAACTAQAQLVIEVEKPAFRISVPGLPAMTMEDHPGRASAPHLRLLGSQGPYTVSLLVPTADAGMTAEECASFTINRLPGRPGVPPQDRIYKARIDPNTYLALYVSPLPSGKQLHAHLLSSAGGTHCVDLHASLVSKSNDDADAWFKAFSGARIEPK